ncbi:MAG: AmmeMemoRadiSam system protein B, partial [Balneolaceae bacterium]|nr:AmmeMemoRadiSam system protein B [Balneolaceae bacterium]
MRNNGSLFSSITEPVPRVRPNLDIIPVENNGKSFLYFHDSMGYATENFALHRQVGPLLSLLDGSKSILDLEPHLGSDVTPDQLLEYIRFLDGNRVLLTPYFQHYAEEVERGYEQSDTHTSVTAGRSYPSDPDELRMYLDEAFTKHRQEDGNPVNMPGEMKALYAPHIDPRVGLASYVRAFSTIRHLTPKRVIILATSHYAGMYPDLYENHPFIVSDKDFRLPNGTISSDRETVQLILEQSQKMGISAQDRAHRIEHSIELHLLFLNHLWEHDFTIVPVLVRGFDELLEMEDGPLGGQVA